MPTQPVTVVAEAFPAPRRPVASGTQVAPRHVEPAMLEQPLAESPLLDMPAPEDQPPSLTAGTGLLWELTLGRDSRSETTTTLRQRDFWLTVWLGVAACLIYVHDGLLLAGG